MLDLTDEQLAEIRRLNAERSAGTWTAEDVGWQWTIETDALLFPDFGGTHRVGAVEHTGQLDAKDLLFMVAASWAVPALIAEVERLRKHADEQAMKLGEARMAAVVNGHMVVDALKMTNALLSGDRQKALAKFQALSDAANALALAQAVLIVSPIDSPTPDIAPPMAENGEE